MISMTGVQPLLASMPPAPPTGVVTQYLFENPWPLALGLIAVGVTIGVTAARSGLTGRFRWAGLMILAGAAVIGVGMMVTTAAEHGRGAVRGFVEALVSGDRTGTHARLAGDVTLNLAQPTNPIIMEEAAIRERIDTFMSNYTVESNSIRMLDGYTQSPNIAIVHLGLFTDLDFPGIVVTKWAMRVRREADDDWLIDRMTLVEVNTKKPQEWMLRR